MGEWVGIKSKWQVRVAIVWIKVCGMTLSAYSKAMLISDINVFACTQIYVITFEGCGNGDLQAVILNICNCVKKSDTCLLKLVQIYKRWERN